MLLDEMDEFPKGKPVFMGELIKKIESDFIECIVLGEDLDKVLVTAFL